MNTIEKDILRVLISEAELKKRVEEIGAVAAAGEKMPQKSTYFYPKLITGLVMNNLETPVED